MRRAPAIAAALLAVTATLAAGVPGASAQVQVTTCVAPTALGNGGFEQPVIGASALQVPQAQVAPWRTTATDGNIELWRSRGVAGIPAAAGNQMTEIAGTQSGTTTYQDIPTVPGALLAYAFSHRGRTGVDTMALDIGPPAGPPNLTRPVSTGTAGWQRLTGEYTVPAGQTTTRIAFRWVRNAEGSTSATGNVLDAVDVSTSVCALTVSKALMPATDDGRFDLLVDDQPAATAVADGGGAGPLAMPFATARVSERAAPGTSLADYVSAVRCRDAASGEPIAQAAGPALTFAYDQPRAVACTFENARVPAVVLAKALYPPDDPGRFDLLVGGDPVARSAGDGTIAGPVDVAPGDVTIAERADADTSAADYESAIECSSGRRQRSVAAFAPGTSVTVPVEPGSLLGCVLLNVRRRAPDPVPPDPEPAPTPGPPAPTPVPAPVPAGGGGEIDLAVRIVRERRRVTAGSHARVRVRVRDRGSLPATGVRLVLSTRQAGLRSRTLKVSMPARAGPCTSARGLAFCYVKRIASGGSVTLTARASSRDLLRPLRLVAVADATEPERVVANNLARTRIRMRRPSGPCASAAQAGPLARAAC